MNNRSGFVIFGERMNSLRILEVQTRFKSFLELENELKFNPVPRAKSGNMAQLTGA
jgi:hypothetical protein